MSQSDPRVLTIGIHIVDILGRPVPAIPDGQGIALLDEIRMTVAGTAAGTAIDMARLGLNVTTIFAQRNRRMKMPERLTVALGEVALHRQELAALEAMCTFVASVRLIVLGELDPFEGANRAHPCGPKIVLLDEACKGLLKATAAKDPPQTGESPQEGKL